MTLMNKMNIYIYLDSARGFFPATAVIFWNVLLLRWVNFTQRQNRWSLFKKMIKHDQGYVEIEKLSSSIRPSPLNWYCGLKTFQWRKQGTLNTVWRLLYIQIRWFYWTPLLRKRKQHREWIFCWHILNNDQVQM